MLLLDLKRVLCVNNQQRVIVFLPAFRLATPTCFKCKCWSILAGGGASANTSGFTKYIASVHLHRPYKGHKENMDRIQKHGQVSLSFRWWLSLTCTTLTCDTFRATFVFCLLIPIVTP